MMDEPAIASSNEEHVRATSNTRMGSLSHQEHSTRPKKKRGRPRFEIHDGSAADVRAHKDYPYPTIPGVLTF